MGGFDNKERFQKIFEGLIKEVERHEVLWNTRSKNHRRKSEWTKAWTEISRKLNISSSAAKTKWKMLRTIFQRHYKQYQPKSPDEYAGKWKYFKLLWFLSDASPIVNGTRKNIGRFNYYFKENNESKSEITSVNLDDDVIEEAVIVNEYYNSDSHSMEEAPSSLNIQAFDTDECFLRSLTPFLKKLNPVRNLVIRRKIEQLLMNELVQS